MPDLIDKKALREAERDLEKLMLKIIMTATGGKYNRTLRKRSGNLRRYREGSLFIEGNKLVVQMRTMYYYLFLDEGTKKIKNPWYLTEKWTTHPKFREIIQRLMNESVKSAVFETVNDIRKK